MFVVKKRFIIIIPAALLIAVLCAVIFATGGEESPGAEELAQIGRGEAFAVPDDTAAVCRDFLSKHGITADFDNATDEYVVIPTKFNAIYKKYNELQGENGLDLSPYMGECAEKVTAELLNSDVRYAVLLVAKDKVIGAHITNGEYGDENLPLTDYGKT
ncbi:MAG: DUF4830 domain-containing protein [Ruminococcus sp.]|nr:DUF4830 domain-containing protein [Ruminococcus sp.]